LLSTVNGSTVWSLDPAANFTTRPLWTLLSLVLLWSATYTLSAVSTATSPGLRGR
jgi:hypothetical protein